VNTEPNAVLRGGSRDGVRAHLGRDGHVSTYRPGTGEEYHVTDFWEGDLRVYRVVEPEPELSRRRYHSSSGTRH
jgi:hypothetical protein